MGLTDIWLETLKAGDQIEGRCVDVGAGALRRDGGGSEEADED